ncbi:Hypothetical protein A7982_00341 [Minicystis rosea]|nr:Hypothetical protein A7982_00341 [Minicystis rosea]
MLGRCHDARTEPDDHGRRDRAGATRAIDATGERGGNRVDP